MAAQEEASAGREELAASGEEIRRSRAEAASAKADATSARLAVTSLEAELLSLQLKVQHLKDGRAMESQQVAKEAAEAIAEAEASRRAGVTPLISSCVSVTW